MGFKEFLSMFVSYNKRVYLKLLIIGILLFYFTFLIYFNYFRILLEYELGTSWLFGFIFAIRLSLFLVILIDILKILFLLQIEKALLVGFFVISLITSLSYLVFPLRVVYFGDIHMVIGCIVGINLVLRNIKQNQSLIIYGIIVGLAGTILAAIFLILFDWIFTIGLSVPSPLTFIIKFEYYFIEAIIIGLTTGAILGSYHFYKRKKSVK